MRNRFLIFGLAFLVLSSCRTPLNIAEIKPEKNISIAENLPESEDFKKIIKPYKKAIEVEMNTKISHTSVDLNKQSDNSNLGNLLSDYTLEGAEDWAKKNGINGIDAAVINIGGIRSTIGKGDILVKNIYEVMPFENELVVIKMKGTDLQGLFDYYLKTQKNNPVSRLYIETENGKIIKALINGKSPEVDKFYYIATSDYLALGGDNMTYFGKGEMISTGIKLRDLYVEKFKQSPEITAPKDVRLKFNAK